jgi:hypothetical protein
MRKRVMALIIALSLSAVGLFAQDKPEPLKLKAGDTAPDFTLLAFDGNGTKPISLHDFRGKKKVLLAFFVFAFTGG